MRNVVKNCKIQPKRRMVMSARQYTMLEYPLIVPIMNFIAEPVIVSSRLVGASVIVTEKWPLTAKAMLSRTYVLMYPGSTEMIFCDDHLSFTIVLEVSDVRCVHEHRQEGYESKAQA